ncbi:hypothetical protein GCM10010116_11510 [Microbispora rosea subsp. aerata]|nr:hypothetical protein [Microbispora rosea]GGO05862.1 hypothetical protein GCM10010116_11510 [Microbispora rosea subsp. aerata]GIH55240.1 hypothetical protein Mro02_21540 [Microbispora rosea subsp. aerata]GLJ82690.1 hypothetical protein GCM10017588_14150 [Microbispora rosea subsp. aerata]
MPTALPPWQTVYWYFPQWERTALDVERTPAWLTACRRPARDYERDPKVSEAIIRWAAVAGMARRLTRSGPARRQAGIVCD